MKRLLLVIGGLCLLLNIFIGGIVTTYNTLNIIINCGVVIITTALIYTLIVINLRDAFRIALALLFAAIGIIELIVGFFLPNQVQDNWFLIAEVFLFSVDILFLIVSFYISNHVSKNK